MTSAKHVTIRWLIEQTPMGRVRGAPKEAWCHLCRKGPPNAFEFMCWDGKTVYCVPCVRTSLDLPDENGTKKVTTEKEATDV